jgi:hypothetical protein
MVAALQQRPEIITKKSGQISGMGQLQAVEILNVQSKLTAGEILEMIQRMDPATISAEELQHYAYKDPAITNVNGKGLSQYITMHINELPVSDAMLSILRHGGLPGMEEWFFCPHQPRTARGDLPGVAL